MPFYSHRFSGLWLRRSAANSCQKFLDHFAANVCQPEIASLESVRDICMVQSKQVENRGMEVVHVHRVLRDAPPDFVRLADDLSALHAAAAHPDAKGERMVIASTDTTSKARTI